jgi:hypothetical protein
VEAGVDDRASASRRPGLEQIPKEISKWPRRAGGEKGPHPLQGFLAVLRRQVKLGGKKGSHPLSRGLPCLRALPETPRRSHHFGNLFWHLLYAFGPDLRSPEKTAGRSEESALEGSLSRPGCCNGSWPGTRMSGAPPATDCDRLWGLKHWRSRQWGTLAGARKNGAVDC